MINGHFWTTQKLSSHQGQITKFGSGNLQRIPNMILKFREVLRNNVAAEFRYTLRRAVETGGETGDISPRPTIKYRPKILEKSTNFRPFSLQLYLLYIFEVKSRLIFQLSFHILQLVTNHTVCVVFVVE